MQNMHVKEYSLDCSAGCKMETFGMNKAIVSFVLLGFMAFATPLQAARRAPSSTPPPPVVSPIITKPVVSPL